MKKSRSIKERIFALLLAIVMIAGIIPQNQLAVNAADGDPIEVEFQIKDSSNKENIQDFKITISEKDSQNGEPIEITEENAEKDEYGNYVVKLSEGEEYTYDVTATGYYDKSDSFSANADDQNLIKIEMDPKVIITKDELNLKVGETEQLSVINSSSADNGEYEWFSDNKRVAEVGDDGKVTAMGEGTTNVGIKFKYGGENKKVSVPVEISKYDTEVELTVSPPDGHDVSEVTLTAFIKHNDQNITGDKLGTVTFTVKQKRSENLMISDTFSENVGSNGIATYKAKINDYLKGKVTISAKYSGNTIYETSYTVADYAYGVDKQIKVEANGINEGKIVFKEGVEFFLTVQDGRDIDFESQNNVAEVTEIETKDNEETIATVKVLKPGDIKILVTANGNDSYNTSEATFTAIAQKELSSDDLIWEEADKVYDGKSAITVKANIKEDAQVEGKALSYEFNAEVVDNCNASIDKKDIKITQVLTNTNDNEAYNYYSLDDLSGHEVKDIVTINHRPVFVCVKKDISASYGQDLAKYVADNVEIEMEEPSDKNPDRGMLSKDEKDYKFSAALEDKDHYYVGTYKVIPGSVSFKNNDPVSITMEGVEVGNYKFSPSSDSSKVLTVTNQELNDTEILQAVKLVNVSSSSESIDNEEKISIFVKNNSKFRLEVRDCEEYKYTDYYDKVYVQLPGESAYINATDNVINISKEYKKGQLEGVRVYLANSQSDDTYTLDSNGNKGTRFDGIYIDNSAPEVKTGKFKMTVLSEFTQSITFGFFQNSSYILTGIEATDRPSSEDDLKIKNAGVESLEYYCWKLTDEYGDSMYTHINEVSLDATAIKNKIDGLSEEEWKDVKVDEEEVEKGGQIYLPNVDKTEFEEGYYILFIRAADKIGNAVVYVSNGMVFETEMPSVNVSGIEDNKSYSDDVEYQIAITEPETYISGINRVEVEVIKKESGQEESTLKRPTEEYDANRTYEDSYTIDFSQKSENDNIDYINDDYVYNLEDFGNDNVKSPTVNGKVTAYSDVSTDITIKVCAYDNAGNKVDKTVTKNFQIDKKAPTVEISYDNNTPQNDMYFKERTATIKYTERNLDTENLTFDIILNGSRKEDVSFAELKDYGITTDVSEPAQIEKEVDESDPDETVYTLRLTFADGRYSIIPKCKDAAGNTNIDEEGNPQFTFEKGTKASDEFVVDSEAPQISVNYETEKTDFAPSSSEDKSDAAYSNKAIEVTVSVEEDNFWIQESDGNYSFGEKESPLDFSAITGAELNGGDVDLSGLKDEFNNISSDPTTWKSNGMYSNTFTIEVDANYEFSFTCTDLAGNETVYAPVYFTFDQTVANGKIEVKTNNNETLLESALNTFTFGIFDRFSNKNISVSMSGSDTTAGVKQLEYYNASAAKSKEEIMALADSAWTPYDEYEISPDNQFIPYLKITDKAGNIEYYTTESGFVADDTQPGVTLTCTNLNDARNGIFSEDAGRIEFSVRAQDRPDEENKTYSGIEKIWYTVRATGNVNTTIEETYLFEAETKDDRTQNDEVRNCTFSIPITERLNSNSVIVTAYAQDLAGNVYHDSEEVSIDITDPTINVTYNLNNPSNGRYYNATRTATVTVTERNFDPSAVRFNITNTDGTQPSISGWSHSAGAGVSDSATHTCTVTFAADGDYTFTLNTTDLAGNTSSYGRVDEFTIDQTDPTIQVSYDNNNDAEPGYFNASRTATVTINEHNFNAADVNAMITASLQGSGASAPGLSGWTTRGDSHTATVTFSSDADYTFDIDYTDLAGNAAADYTQDSFTVDQTAPEIEFFDITDKSANKGEVAPGVRYSDINYTESGVEITLTGANNGDESVDGIRSSIPNGQSIKLEDFAHEKEVDDLYTMTAVVTDRAGNDTEQSVMFSVNRFGSVYVMSTDTQELLDKVYTNEEQDLVVTEINVDSLVFNGISSGRDGNLTTLTEGEDYTVRESGAEDSWKQYTYTIDKENFETEGNYTVTIESEDQAENLSSTQVKKVQSPTDETQLYELEFAVDKTAPTVVLTGIEDGGQYRSNVRDVTVNTSDNIAMGDVKVYLGNSDEATTFSAEDIQAADGELTYTIPSSNTRQDIRAVATDAAGNTSETEINRVLVTSNLFVQFYSNTPLLAGSIAGVVVIAAALWYFLIFKRKKDEEKQANRR